MIDIKRIGVMTSGGDCAGLNAVLRAITYHAIQNYDWEVVGIHQGGHGFLTSPLKYTNLTMDSFSQGILQMGGTILGSTNKHNPFSYKEDGEIKDVSQRFIDSYHKLNLDAIIAVGGEGSLQLNCRLMEKSDMRFVMIPKTIDNDIGMTDCAVGFRTAVDIVTEALDRLHPTAASHERVMILEVMGRDAGHIALQSGISGGADVILIPEISYCIENIVKKIQCLVQQGKNYALIVVSEAVKTETGKIISQVREGQYTYGGIGHYISDKLNKKLSADVRHMALGHVQRGGQPSSFDRLLAASFGVTAVNLVAEKNFNRLVVWKNNEVSHVLMKDALKFYNDVNTNCQLVKVGRGLGISFGD